MKKDESQKHNESINIYSIHNCGDGHTFIPSIQEGEKGLVYKASSRMNTSKAQRIPFLKNKKKRKENKKNRK